MRHDGHRTLNAAQWYGETLGANHQRAITINSVSTKSGAVHSLSNRGDLEWVTDHQYFGVNLDIVWSVVREKLPGLRVQMEAILKGPARR